MFSNYLKIAWRNLANNKLYTSVNMAGLTLSLTAVLLISLYIKDDLSFDKMHKNGDRIYRLVNDIQEPDQPLRKMGNTGYPQGPAFKAEIPEFTLYCRMRNGWNTIVKKKDEGLKEKLMYVDNTFFDMFSFPTLSGENTTSLDDIKKVVITDKFAKKYFGEEEPIGKILEVGDLAGEFKPFIVSAVVKSPPSNSSIQFDLLLSFNHMISADPAQRANDENWYNSSLNTFLLVNSSTDMVQLQSKMDQVTAKYTEPVTKATSTSKPDQSRTNKYRLQPLHRMHLDKEYYASNGLEYWSDSKYPKVLAGLGLLIVLIACINFINLTLARSFYRMKEIGIRKTSGGTQNQLFFQFISESLLICLLAFILSLLLAKLALPVFSFLTDKYLDPAYLFQPQSLFLFLGIALFVTVIAGVYPSMLLSRFHPIESIKGTFRILKRHQFGRALVVVQFVIAGVMIFCTAVAIRQFSFITHSALGYETKNRIRFWLPWDQIADIAPKIKNELALLPYIKQVSSKSGDWNGTMYTINGKRSEYIYYEHIDENHLQLMGIPLISGRYFSNEFSTDTSANIIVNESFVHTYLADSKDPYRAEIRTRRGHLHIVGIVKDFYYGSFKEKIKPIVWLKDDGTQAGCMHIQVDEMHLTEALSQVKEIYKKYVPYLPIEYHFLDDFRMDKYSEDLRWKNILTYAAFLSIFIACIGLFALASFMIEQRTKEIGIRKVLGASILDITTLVSKHFLLLVMIAITVAGPIGYLFMNKWLQEFAYRITIHWGYFLITSLVVLSISLLTVSVQAIKAAIANPVSSLKNE